MASDTSLPFNLHLSSICYRKISPDRAKKCLAPINELNQYDASNYHYEQIHLHPGWRRAPRGM